MEKNFKIFVYLTFNALNVTRGRECASPPPPPTPPCQAQELRKAQAK